MGLTIIGDGKRSDPDAQVLWGFANDPQLDLYFWRDPFVAARGRTASPCLHSSDSIEAEAKYKIALSLLKYRPQRLYILLCSLVLFESLWKN
eukprot:6095289-Amphidinium_carterae.1